MDRRLTDLADQLAAGLDLVAEARRLDPQAVAIVLTGYGSFPSAVESMQVGVFDYLTKPSNLDQLKQAKLVGQIVQRPNHRRILRVLRFHQRQLIEQAPEQDRGMIEILLDQLPHLLPHSLCKCG